MAISRKGKRKIVIDSKKYLWWIFDEYDQGVFDGVQIKIVPENQVGYVQYGLQQEDRNRRVVTALREDKYAVGMFCPKFEDEKGIIKPSGIEKLIRWILDSSEMNNRMFIHENKSGALSILKLILEKFHN